MVDLQEIYRHLSQLHFLKRQLCNKGYCINLEKKLNPSIRIDDFSLNTELPSLTPKTKVLLEQSNEITRVLASLE